jgi:molybdopterin converting factor small subunit
MKITLSLYATLRDFLPTDSGGKAVLDLDLGATISQAMAAVGVPVALAHIILVNGRHVLRPDVPARQLAEGDHLAVFPAIGGG